MEIVFIKPGVSEYKRSQLIPSLTRVLDAFAYAKKQKLTWTFLSKNNRELCELYLQFGVLKKQPKSFPWNDRLSSFFQREGLIKLDENDFMVPGNLGILLKNKEINTAPFSMHDFKIILYMLEKEKKGHCNSYLQRSLSLVLEKEISENDFFKEFLVKDRSNLISYLLGELEKNRWSYIEKKFRPGSGSKDKSKSNNAIVFAKTLLDDIKECFNSSNPSNIFVNKILKFGDKNLRNKDWRWYLIKAMEFTFDNKNIETVSSLIRDKKIDITKELIVNFILNFMLAKKIQDYSYLIKQNLLTLPLFEETKTGYIIPNEMKEIAKHIISIQSIEISDKANMEDLYNKIVPLDNRFDYIDKEKFYPKITKNFLSEILNDEKLWNDKIIKPKYRDALPNIDETNLPTYYEFITILALYTKLNMLKTYHNFEKSINTMLDSKFQPLRFASGGRSDGVLKMEDKTIIIEPTLMLGRRQFQFEVGIIEHFRIHEATICIMVSPKFHRTTIDHIDRWRVSRPRSKELFIYPMTQNNILKMEDNLNFSSLRKHLEKEFKAIPYSD